MAEEKRSLTPLMKAIEDVLEGLEHSCLEPRVWRKVHVLQKAYHEMKSCCCHDGFVMVKQRPTDTEEDCGPRE